MPAQVGDSPTAGWHVMTGQAQRPRHATCGARKRQGEGACTLPAGWGTSHPGTAQCKLHGGSMPNNVAHAIERQARAAAEKFGVPVKTTAAAALQGELARTAGIICWLLARVQALDEDQLTWGTSERKIRNPAGGQQGQGQPAIEVTQSGRPHVYVSMLERERHHLANVAAEMARIGIEAHAVRVAEVAGGRILQVLEAYAAELGHDPRDLGVRTAAVRALAAVPDA
jgi:hypothetical protein